MTTDSKLVDDTTVQVTTEVAAPAARAFHVFTAQIGTWWDDDKHILEAPLAEMVFEPFVGGNIIDRGTDGSECRWSRVLAYDPPQRVLFSWDINTRWKIETDLDRTSEIEITFTEIAPDRTRVVLTHRHLDRHGEGWETMRDAVAGGWNLDSFTSRIASTNEVIGHALPVISDTTMRERLTQSAGYTAILLHKTDRFARPEADPIVWEHGRRNMALVEAGLLAVVLPVPNDETLAGIGIFTTNSEETDEIMAGDPGVAAGIFRYDIHPVRGFPGAALP